MRSLILAYAASSAIAIAGGAWAWHAHVDAIASLLDAQATEAHALLAERTYRKHPRLVLTAIGRDTIALQLVDRDTGEAWLRNGRSPAVPLPPPPLPGFGPGPSGFARPNPPGRSARYAVADLAHIRPRRVVAGSLVLRLLPEPDALSLWLATDAGIVLGAILLLGIATWSVGDALARARREPLARTTVALEGLAAGNFAPRRVAAGDAPEIARLARAYNAAAETVSRSIEERTATIAEFQRFLGDAGHELRTPLTVVAGYLDILERALTNENELVRRSVDAMVDETRRMRGLIEKMLLLSKMSCDVAAPSRVPVKRVADDVVDAMARRFPAREVEVRCDARACVWLDEDDLYEALRNLVDNALRYAPDSIVKLDARVDGPQVEIEVADGGPGIPVGEQSKVFERFYRAGEDRDAEGSGLGLAIVWRVAERWDGKVDLRSTPGETRFVLRFPLAESAA